MNLCIPSHAQKKLFKKKLHLRIFRLWFCDFFIFKMCYKLIASYTSELRFELSLIAFAVWSSILFAAAEWGFTEPFARCSLCSWWAFIVHMRTRTTMIMERKTIAAQTILTYFLRGLQWLRRISEKASFTDSHSTKLSIPGYAFSRVWMELV